MSIETEWLRFEISLLQAANNRLFAELTKAQNERFNALAALAEVVGYMGLVAGSPQECVALRRAQETLLQAGWPVSKANVQHRAAYAAWEAGHR